MFELSMQRANVELTQTTFGKGGFKIPLCPPADAFPQLFRANFAVGMFVETFQLEPVLEIFRE